MPLTKLAPDAFGVVTICLVALLVLLGVLCIIYSFYFQSHVHKQGFIQLGYFSGPWIVRIAFILFAIWWGFGEIIRLSLLRLDGRLLNAFNLRWQENACKWYIVSNLGFAEPCLFLTLMFLLRAPLRSGSLSRKWNGKTAGYVILYCLPVLALQLVVILVGPRLNSDSGSLKRLPNYFTRTYSRIYTNQDRIALCTYPLLSTVLHGLFATILTAYLFWLGRQILKLVINKCLQKRVYTLIFAVSSFLPLRVVLLSLSVLTKPEDILFEALAFLAFLALVCCAGVSIFLLVYFPVSDSMALRGLWDSEEERNCDEESGYTPLFFPNAVNSGEISSRQESGLAGPRYVELSQFSSSREITPPGSPSPLGWHLRLS